MQTFLLVFAPILSLTVGLTGGYLLVKTFLEKRAEENYLQLQLNTVKESLPLRLQAYERLALLLERITPSNLIIRLNDPSLNVAQWQAVLIHHIREEYNHNMSQQIYVSDQVWEVINATKENLIGLINSVAQGIDPEAPSLELSKGIIHKIMENQDDFAGNALLFIKQEARAVIA